MKSVELSQSSGDAAFDDLALRQSRLATCKPVMGFFGKSIPVETTFVFAAAPANIAAHGLALHPYGQKLHRLIRANLGRTSEIATSPVAISVNCSPNGKLLSATIVHSSGDSALDNAALKAVQDSDSMPFDDNGKTPAHFTITYDESR